MTILISIYKVKARHQFYIVLEEDQWIYWKKKNLNVAKIIQLIYNLDTFVLNFMLRPITIKMARSDWVISLDINVGLYRCEAIKWLVT